MIDIQPYLNTLSVHVNKAHPRKRVVLDDDCEVHEYYVHHDRKYLYDECFALMEQFIIDIGYGELVDAIDNALETFEGEESL